MPARRVEKIKINAIVNLPGLEELIVRHIHRLHRFIKSLCNLWMV
jgi:hypothetical protein